MNPNDFFINAPGSLVPARGKGFAFVPAPVPPKDFPLDFGLANRLSEADVALTMLEGLAHRLPDPEILLHPFLFKEAVDSSRIEGTQTTYSDMLLYEAASASQKRSADPDTKVTRNYINALNYGVEALKTLPISRRLICDTHEMLMRGYNERTSRPGEIRTGQVVIGSKTDTPETARFVPPPANRLEDLIGDFERFCNNYRGMPLLIRAAIMHYQFETIHPFWDGNGRVGRLLISLMLTAEKRLSWPMLYLSGYLEKHRKEYYDNLLAVSQQNDWRRWVMFFLDAVIDRANDACTRVVDLHDLRHKLRARITGKKRGVASDIELLEIIFKEAIVTVSLIHERLGLSKVSSRDAIGRLEKMGILQRLPIGGKTHFWISPEIARTVFGLELVGAEPEEAQEEAELSA